MPRDEGMRAIARRKAQVDNAVSAGDPLNLEIKSDRSDVRTFDRSTLCMNDESVSDRGPQRQFDGRRQHFSCSAGIHYQCRLVHSVWRAGVQMDSVREEPGKEK